MQRLQNFNSIKIYFLQELFLSKLQKRDSDKFKFLVSYLLEPDAPTKEKCIRRNQKPFITRIVRKAVMVWTLLNKLAYIRNRNFCVELIKKTKGKFIKTSTQTKLLIISLFGKP